MKCLILLLIIQISFINSLNVCVSSDQIGDANFKALIDDIDKFLPNDNTRMAAKIVRLNFHDCVSGCNGCVDLENSDNTGLMGAVGLAARIHLRHEKKVFYGKYKLSRADIYALMGYRAIYSTSNVSGLTLPTCEFKIGRKDCTGPQDNKEIFAKSIANWEEMSQFYINEFKFNTQEIVALMGAHGIGQTCRNNSGHNGAWVAFDYAVFSNAFYTNLLDKNMDYRPHKYWDGKNQWFSYDGNTVRNPTRLMLNADMCMLKKFSIDRNGRTSCTFDTCETNTEPAEWVNTYANSEPTFKKDFSNVFSKMMEHGYEGTNALIDINPTSSRSNIRGTDYERESLSTIWKNFENATPEKKFEVFNFVYKKEYKLGSEEAKSKFAKFKSNLDIIQKYNSEPYNDGLKYTITAYTDMDFDDYVMYKYRISVTEYTEYVGKDFHKYSHLVSDA